MTAFASDRADGAPELSNAPAGHPAETHIAGVRVALDPAGALLLPESGTLIVSDLHLEKGASFARRGVMLPPYDTAATLARLAALVARYRPQTVVSLGDSFHDADASAGLDEADRARLSALIEGRRWVWIRGNHDPLPPDGLAGEVCEAVEIGGLTFRHEPGPRPAEGEIAGHLHPAATVVARGRRLRRRCFASDGSRLVMPSFGAYTGGLCVRDPAVSRLFGPDYHAWMLGETRVHPVRARRLVPDSAMLGRGLL